MRRVIYRIALDHRRLLFSGPGNRAHTSRTIANNSSDVGTGVVYRSKPRRLAESIRSVSSGSSNSNTSAFGRGEAPIAIPSSIDGM